MGKRAGEDIIGWIIDSGRSGRRDGLSNGSWG